MGLNRIAVWMIGALLLAGQSPAWGQGLGVGVGPDNPGNATPPAVGQQENGNAGQGPGNSGNTPAAGAPAGVPATPQTPAIPETPAAPVAAPPAPAAPEIVGPDGAGGQTVPLETLLPGLRSETGGEIVDAELVRINGVLFYQIKVLTTGGELLTRYYDAGSGQPVEQP